MAAQLATIGNRAFHRIVPVTSPAGNPALQAPRPVPRHVPRARADVVSLLRTPEAAKYADADPIDAIAQQVVFGRERAIFRQGDEVTSVYMVADGVIRLYKLLPDGRRQIVRFLRPGDFMGLAFTDCQPYTAEAVTPAIVKRIARSRLEALMEEQPQLRRRLMAVTADELTAAQDQMLLLGRKNAQEKICSFLVGLAERDRRRHDGTRCVHLAMSRTDIADYLGLTIETVSRTISKLKASRLIRLLDGGKVEIPDIDRLAGLAEGS